MNADKRRYLLDLVGLWSHSRRLGAEFCPAGGQDSNRYLRRSASSAAFHLCYLRPSAALFVSALSVAWLLFSASAATHVSTQSAVRAVERLRVEVVRSYPHDRNAFTQGLVLDAGILYESTGLVGRSSLRQV